LILYPAHLHVPMPPANDAAAQQKQSLAALGRVRMPS